MAKLRAPTTFPCASRWNEQGRRKDMKRPMAIAGSAAFLLVAPGIVAGVVPWLLTGRYSTSVTPAPILAPLGGVLILGGIALLLNAFVRFALEGEGTPAPVAPTERLVV